MSEINTAEVDDVAFWARVQYILEQAVVALEPADVAERVAWCQRTGQHGVTAFDEPGGNAVRMEWGGRTLVVISRDVFAGTAYLDDLEWHRLPAAPDDAAALGGE